MTKIEALELELAARKMVEGTELEWWEVVWRDYMRVKSAVSSPPQLELYQLSLIELALGIIEGKTVWEGDTIYIDGAKIIIGAHSVSTLHEWNKAGLVSWNPPTPKTIMVELAVEDAKWMAATFNSPNPGSPSNIASACRKVLENLK